MIVIYKKEGMYVMTRKIVLDIKALRKEKNMTISELANRLNKTIFEIKTHLIKQDIDIINVK